MDIDLFTQMVLKKMDENGIVYTHETLKETVFETIEKYEDLSEGYNDALIEDDFTTVNQKIELSLRKFVPLEAV